jgi:hypothetical protein
MGSTVRYSQDLIEPTYKENTPMRMRLLAVLTFALGAGGLGFTAQAASAARMELRFQLTSHQPGTPTGATLHIVYPNDGPGGKPKPVSLGVYRFPRGTTIDEGAVPVCLASDAEFELLGASACPPDTALGGGGLTVDTGFGPPIDPLVLDDSYFHGPGELITAFRPREAPGPVLQVNRLQIEGSTIIDRPSLPPGYPQGTKTVAKEVNDEIAPVSSGGQAFMTTPPKCPRSGSWISRLTITYEDGTMETATSATPCAR